MEQFKDNFSKQADLYARYRPLYPKDLYDYLESICEEKDLAWDCATGNGQVAFEIARFFDKVIATDASQAQIDFAKQSANIDYRVATAENSGLESESVSLITVGQAIHWFDFEKFYAEVSRVAKKNALLAIWGYGLHRIDAETDKVIDYFYKDIIGEYWDKERKHIDNAYTTTPFPFEVLPSPVFQMQTSWNLEDLIGYLNTWSSVQKYIKTHQKNPVGLITPELEEIWGDTNREKLICWDIYLKVGKIL